MNLHKTCPLLNEASASNFTSWPLLYVLRLGMAELKMFNEGCLPGHISCSSSAGFSTAWRNLRCVEMLMGDFFLTTLISGALTDIRGGLAPDDDDDQEKMKMRMRRKGSPEVGRCIPLSLHIS